MEVFQDALTGLYEIRFDDQPQAARASNSRTAVRGCFHDADCSGARVCAVNETWSAFPSQCTCDALLGFVGRNCDEWGVGTVYTVALLIATIVVVSCSSSASIYCVWAIAKLKERWKSNLFIAVMCTALANLQFLAAVSLVLYNAVSFPYAYAIFAGPDDRYPDRLIKEQSLANVHIIMISLAYILSTLAMFFLLGVWASIALRFNEMSPAQAKAIERICALYTIFALAVFVPTGLIYVLWIVNGVIAAIVGLVLTVGFLVIGIKVRRITGYIPRERKVEDSEIQRTQKQSSTRILLRRIYLTSLALSCLCGIAVITLALYAVGPYRRSTYIPPAFVRAPREVSYRLAFITCALADLVVTIYLTLTVMNKLRAAKASERSLSQTESPNPQFSPQLTVVKRQE